MYADTVKIPWKDDAVRILCVDGFIRKNGNTQRVLNSFLDELSSNADIRHFDCYSESPHTCTGCNYCEEAGRCRFDDLNGFFELLETADIIIFAAPVYNLSFPAPVKALIDRFQVYYSGYFKNGRVQQIPKRRRGYLVSTSGHEGSEGFGVMERQLKNAFSILNIEYAGARTENNTDLL